MLDVERIIAVGMVGGLKQTTPKSSRVFSKEVTIVAVIIWTI